MKSPRITDIEKLYHLSILYYEKSQYQEAIETLSLLHKLDPLHKKAFKLLGNCYKNIGNYKEAIEWYEVSLANYMYDKESYILIAECFINLGKNREAKEILKEVLEIYPNYSKAKRILDSLH